MTKANIISSFSLFKTYQQLLSPSETATLLRLLERKIKFVRILETSLIVSLILGILWFALYGYIIPYYRFFLDFSGWKDSAAMFLMIALIGIPAVSFLLFNSVLERLSFFYAILSGLEDVIAGDIYYISLNVWGFFSTKKIPYHIGGYALTEKENRWYGGTVIYSKSSSVYYDNSSKSNRTNSKYYANFSLFYKKSDQPLATILKDSDSLEKFVKETSGLSSFEASTYRHLGRKGQLEKVQSEIKLGFKKSYDL